MEFKLPPIIYNHLGEIRKVGFELEFSGMDLPSISDVIVQVVGGDACKKSDYTWDIQTPLGLFRTELDSSFFKEKRYAKYLLALGLDPEESLLGHEFKQIIESVGELFVPFEIITPPLAINHLEILEKLRQRLHSLSAKGTKSAPFRAFGLQFNPEVPDKSVATFLAYLKAFFVLFDWLYEESHVPVSRMIAPYIHPFPMAYVELVVNPAYAPDLNQFMNDYLRYNPTRNRPLDLLPLFSLINKDLVFSFPVEKKLVKPRPTFHYRLPNSEVDDPDWSIACEWNRWVDVEKLASNVSELFYICGEYHRALTQDTFERKTWIQITKDWIHG